jgi:hypothetical protein
MGSYTSRLPADQTHDEWMDSFDGRVKDVQRPTQQPANESGDCVVESAPLVPEGEYKLAYVEHFTQKVRGNGKLQINFSITQGDFSGEILPAYYRVKLTGPPGKHGPFNASKQGEYYEQMCDLFPELIDGRSDRISPQRLKGKVVLCEVVTVKKKWSGDERKAHTQYSKIKRMIKLC